MRFSGVFVVSSLIVSALALPTADFTSQLNALSVKVKAATAQVQSFDGTLSQFTGVHNGAIVLAQSITSTNEALKPYLQFTASESSANLVASEALVSGMEMLCDALISKKTTFAKVLNGIQIVRSDSTAVAAPAFVLVQGLISRTPKSDVPKAIELNKRAMAKFERLLMEYRN